MAASALPTLLTLPRTSNHSLLHNPNPVSSPICRLSPHRRPPTVALQQKSSPLWRISASTEDVLAPEAVVEKAQQVVPAAANDGVGSTVVSALLTAAFVGLSVLTIGVIYIAVTDFLQKREREKFEKEEAANKKGKKKKKVEVKARSGPRGFGQKIEEEEDDY